MVNVREIGEDEKDYWDREIQRFPTVHPLNAYGWGAVRTVDSWTPIYLVAEEEGEFRGGMTVLAKKIPFTPFSIFYGQRGPVCDIHDSETVARLMEKTRELAREWGGIFIRIDPSVGEDEVTADKDVFTSLGLKHLEQRWTFWNAPRDVSRVDLTKCKTSEELLALLHRDTRRCIRKAGKEGVTIEPATKEKDVRNFYEIFSTFSVDKGFMSRGLDYQLKLWETYIEPKNGRLFLAKYKGEIIGGLICIMFGKKCLAMHMGTPYRFQKLQTYYAYVWEGISWAKENGCEWFSFRGVGTTPSQEYFKKKFMPDVVALVGYYDLPFRPLLYRLFYFAEFSVLPRAWPVLIRLRKLYHWTLGIIGGKGE